VSICPPIQGITTSIALQQGFGSTAFAVSFAFSCIVMYDAAGVRRHAGEAGEHYWVEVQQLVDGAWGFKQ
jgi:acid phosphatase family membrane protein YuiD